jgi:CDP-diacylglycerol--serine O-phosphatidyltransferase
MAVRVPRRYIMGMLVPPSERGHPGAKRSRFRAIPVRTLVPNVITLLALCAGLAAIRVAVEGRFELALAAIVFAAVLDGLDGRIARMIKGASRFGAELDSLADFVNFGVAPGLILYFWGLQELGNLGWIAAMVFAICAGLRLARFNVAIDDPNRPIWAGNFFTGVPAPAGAITVLLPMYIYFLGLRVPAVITFVYTLAIAFLMVSRLPVFSGKKLGTRVPPEMVLPVVVLVVLFIVVLITFPWQLLTIGTLAYLAALPLGWLSAREYQRKDAAAALPQPEPARSMESPPDSPPSPSDRPDSEPLTRH